MLNFELVPRDPTATDRRRGIAFLVEDNWDDFTFRTLFTLHIVDIEGLRHNLGGVKIARRGMATGRTSVPTRFDTLPEGYYSLGQDAEYYGALGALPDELREHVSRAMKDVVADESLLSNVQSEDAFKVSLLRFVPLKSVRGEFRRLYRSLPQSTPFHFLFRYRPPTPTSDDAAGVAPPLELEFRVTPESRPPSHVYALIGPNGAGKSTILRQMWLEASGFGSRGAEVTSPSFEEVIDAVGARAQSPTEVFANVLSISLSAFDGTSDPRMLNATGRGDARHVHVGLLKRAQASASEELIAKSPTDLSDEFCESLRSLQKSQLRRRRWLEALMVLSGEPLIADLQVQLTSQDASAVRTTFQRLSSGHRAVLLALARLIELCNDRTLVLIDEPEAHLHPTLLSAYVRVLSETVVAFNSVGVLATHSPVVLQEIPSRCAFLALRVGDTAFIERPERETFGESVGTLTREVFRHSFEATGFIRLVRESAERGAGYDEALEALGGSLGAEGRAALRAIVANRGRAQ